MVRSISSPGMTKLATRLGIEPIIIVEVDWVAGATPLVYADRNVGSIPGRILEVGDLDTVISVSDNNSSQEISVILDDSDGSLKAILDAHDVHKRDVRVYQWFEGMVLSDRFLLFSGKISSPVVWSERERTLSFTVVSQLEDKEIGFSAEEGQFPYLPKDLVGKAWPIVFGTILDSPTLQVNHAVTGTTLEGVGILAGRDAHIAVPLGKQDTADYLMELARQQAYSHFLHDCAEAWKDADSKKAAELCKEELRTWNNITNNADYRSRVATTAQAKRLETLSKAPEKTAIHILGGSDFPQNQTLTLNINGGLFTGQFDGDVFSISARSHPTYESKAQADLLDDEDKAVKETSRQATWEFSMEVPPGKGDFTSDKQDTITRMSGTRITALNRSQPGLQQVATFFWAEAGERVFISSAEPIAYIVSIVPGTVLAVKAYKQFVGGPRLVNVPTELYSVKTVTYGSVTSVQIVFNKALSTIPDQGWQDDIYVTFQSSVGPNTVDILKYLIDTFTDLTYDDASFNYVKSKLTPFPMNFALHDRRNAIQVLQEIAFQARCALWLSNGQAYLKYLPEEPTADSTIALSDVDAEVGIDVEYTNTEDLVTKMVVTWRLSLAQKEPNRIILRHNVKKYGTQEQAFDFYCYNQPDIIVKCATFWLIRLANTWKKVRFTTFLQKLHLEPFDTVSLDFGGKTFVASGGVKAVVRQATYNSADNTINFECATPVKAGEMTAYRFYWPSQLEVTDTWPTDAEIEAGYAGGDNIGSDAIGELPVGDMEGTNYDDTYIGGMLDQGDYTPTDVGFTARDALSSSTFGEIDGSPKPTPNLSLNYATLPPLQPPANQSSGATSSLIDIRTTIVVDSLTGKDCTLDTFFKKISDARELVLDTAKAKFGSTDQPDGKVFDFQYDTEAAKFGTGIAYLKD